MDKSKAVAVLCPTLEFVGDFLDDDTFNPILLLLVLLLTTKKKIATVLDFSLLFTFSQLFCSIIIIIIIKKKVFTI